MTTKQALRALFPDMSADALDLLVAAKGDDSHATTLKRHARKSTGTEAQRLAGAAIILLEQE